jgi:hypothetical protein
VPTTESPKSRRNALGQISVVAPAPGDEATVSDWLRELDLQIDLFRRAVRAFVHQKTHRFKQLIYKSSRRELEADYVVRDFGFWYC